MTTGLKTVVYPVRDLGAAKPVYAALLGQPHTDMPYYVGFNVDGQEIGLNPQRAPAGHDRPGRLLARPRRTRRPRDRGRGRARPRRASRRTSVAAP